MVHRMCAACAGKLGPSVLLIVFLICLTVLLTPRPRHSAHTPTRGGNRWELDPGAIQASDQFHGPETSPHHTDPDYFTGQETPPHHTAEDPLPVTPPHHTHAGPQPQTRGFRDMLAVVTDRKPDTQALWDFSRSTATQEAINKRNVTLPWVLRGYRNPCWLEHLSPEQTYASSYYLRHDCMEQAAVRKSLAWAHDTNRERRRYNRLYRNRCFPYFFLLGVAKSGTTDLYYCITRYLNNVISGARKEPHYWNRRRLGISSAGSCYNQPGPAAQLSDYLDLYDEASEKIRLRADPDHPSYHPLVTGDFTPATLFSSPRWWRYPGNEGLTEPRYTTPHYLHSLYPQPKLIIILRDPVERAYSQMRYRNLPEDGQVAEAFHSLVINTLRSLQDCTNLRGCVYNRTDPEAKDAAENEVIIPGLYVIFIRDWLKVFPREQFLFLLFENYVTDRVTAIDKVSSFLEIDPLMPADREAVARRNISNYGYAGEPMWAKTRDILRQFYRPWNHKLAQLLGNHGFQWGY